MRCISQELVPLILELLSRNEYIYGKNIPSLFIT